MKRGSNLALSGSDFYNDFWPRVRFLGVTEKRLLRFGNECRVLRNAQIALTRNGNKLAIDGSGTGTNETLSILQWLSVGPASILTVVNGDASMSPKYAIPPLGIGETE